MTAKPPNPRSTDSQTPFGTQPRRPSGWLVFWSVLYIGWLLALLWMAAFEVGR